MKHEALGMSISDQLESINQSSPEKAARSPQKRSNPGSTKSMIKREAVTRWSDDPREESKEPRIKREMKDSSHR